MLGRKQMIRATPEKLVNDRSGVVAIEFAFIALFLCLGVVNVSDTGIYLYKRMEVENAAQVGAMSALKTCDLNHLPATINSNCPALTAAVTAAIESTSLGSNVTLNGITEGYYCVNSSNTLQKVGNVSSPRPPDCTAAGMPALRPVDYLQVPVTFGYTPLFSGISVAGLFATPITKTTMTRME
jgi:Flp pilus assembly protein TadG